MESEHLGSLELVTDTSVGDWAVANAGEWGTVACVVPAAFEDYARIFHPALREVAPEKELGLDARHPAPEFEEVRWSEIAAANDRIAHPAMEWASVTGHWRYHWGGDSQPGLWDIRSEEGTLPAHHVAALAAALASHTTTPDEILFAIWEGFGEIDWPPAPRLRMPGRDMVLFRGPLSEATTSFGGDHWDYRSPSLWWPVDRAWCVGTDVDLSSSYVGGSRECIDALCALPALEVMRVTSDQSLSADADQINPEPEGNYPSG